MASTIRKGLFFLFVVYGFLIFAPQNGIGGDDDIMKMPNCPICNMDRKVFSHSRMALEYADGSAFGSCSLHCVALELAYHPGKVPVKIMVGDFNSRELIDAEKAVWVMGGNKMGVMTTNAKWAFGVEKDARLFISQNGGRIVSFEDALSAAYADMYKDTQMIREKRKKKKKMKTTGQPQKK